MRVRTLRAIAGGTLLVIGVVLFIVAACVAGGAVASLPDGPVSEGGVLASAAFAIAGAVLFVPAVVLIAWRKPPTVKERHLPTNLSHIVQFPSATDHADEWQYTYASQQFTMRVTLGDDRAKRLHDDKYKDLLQEETHVLLLLRGEQRLRTALIKMDGDHSRLLYRLTDRPTWESVTLSQVREVRMGQRTRTFEYVGRRFREVSDLSFSIIYGEALASLDIVCNNPSDYVTWTVGLRLAAAFSDNGDPHKLWIKAQWEKLGKTQQDELTVEEVGTIVAMMNLKLRKADHTLQRLFSNADMDGNALLNFAEFLQFFEHLSARADVDAIFDEIPMSDKHKRHLNPLEFAHFLSTTQHIPVTIAQAERLIRELNGRHCPAHRAHMLSRQQFHTYMTSRESDLLRPAGSPDMSQPLSHYFISSSHNTYLTGDQLKSDSSVDAYIRALQLGCRCVELDCWDGPNGEPIITHGHTMTSKISFASVVQAIRKYAFHTTPYPLVLSFENHCSIPQQVVMARILTECLGDMLAPWPADHQGELLPSPESLKNKILIKAKTSSTVPLATAPDEDDEEDSSDDDIVIVSVSQSGSSSGAMRPPNARGRSARSLSSPPVPEWRAADSSSEAAAEHSGPPSGGSSSGSAQPSDVDEPPLARSDSTTAPASRPAPPLARIATQSMLFASFVQGTPKNTVAAELSSIVYLAARRFKGFADVRATFSANNMVSFGEGKVKKLAGKYARDIAEYNLRYLARIYPGGKRVDSSNYDPVRMWKYGFQMVALNYQTPDTGLQLNRARFRCEGATGYVLKPAYMRSLERPFEPTHRQPRHRGALTVTVVSAQRLPKPRNARLGSVVDPYVEVEVWSCVDEMTRKRTRAIQGNGLNPTWNETFEFMYDYAELTFVRFVVMSEDSTITTGDVQLATFSFCLADALQGYRHMPLEHASGEVIAESSLFVKLMFGPISASTKTRSLKPPTLPVSSSAAK